MIVCADDYGLAPDIDEAILNLCGRRKLSAVSCMVLLQRCTEQSLARLRQFESDTDIGLHLCLTDEGLPLSGAPPNLPSRFGALLRGGLMQKIDPAEVASAVAEQYKIFFEKTGRRPDYIDGHLHTHQLPGVREGLLHFLESLTAENRPYVRNTHLPPRALLSLRLPFFKAVGIGAFGARMRKLLRAKAIRTNEGFAGIYDFAKWPNYPKYLPRFASALNHSNGILVTHPGQRENWRREEYGALASFSFPARSPNRFQQK